MPYEYSEMKQAEIEEFLRVPRFAIVGTNPVNGPPQLTPVWYLYESGQIYISILVKSAKYRNLHRDPRISVCIAGDNPDARAVMFYGTAELTLKGSAWDDEIEWRLVRRYFDSDKAAQEYMDSPDYRGESALVKVAPEKVIAQDFN
jgi:PPOX class probable F420-dependent enzyme